MVNLFGFVKNIASRRKTPRGGAERKLEDSYSDHTTAVTGQYTEDGDTTHHSVLRHRDNDHDSVPEQSWGIEESALSSGGRRETKRERSQDPYYDNSRDAVSTVGTQAPISRHGTERRKVRKPRESRKYGKEEIRALEKENEELKLQLDEANSLLQDAEDTSRHMKQKLRKAEEDLRQLAKRDGETTSQHRRGQSFETKIRQQAADISSLKERLRRAEANNSQTTRLLDMRTTELKGSQAFLTKADSFAGADLIKMVESLNSEIFQSAAFMSEGLEFDEIASGNARLNSQTMGRARILLGTAMLSRILAKPPNVDPLPLQLGLQSMMISRCVQIVQSIYPMENRVHNDFLRKIYTGIQASEEQAVAGRWRAMTQAQLKPSRAYAPQMVEDVVSVLIVCGLSTSNARYQVIIQDIEHRMSTLEKAALELKAALKEGVTSVDMEPFSISSRSEFNPADMDDAYEDSREDTGNRRDRERIMCTTDMGLRRVVVKRSIDGPVESSYDVLLKPKVALASSLTNEAEA